ncbi:hypothetical protein M569_15188, partial [Genlisea aurea]
MPTRVVVVSSSDEEREEHRPPQQVEYEDFEDVIIEDIEADLQTVTINSSNATPDSYFTASANSSTSVVRNVDPIPIHISEGEEEIVENGDSGFSASNGYFEVSDSPVSGFLERMGLRLRREWMSSCLHALESSVNGFLGMDDAMKAKLCFGQFIQSDMNYCGAGVLPPNVRSLHLVDLKGPFVLQVDEIVNISYPLRGRYQNAASGLKRCLKLSMTDGVQRVFGMEYRPIKDLEVLAPSGLKVAICNVNVRRGLLMLVPEVVQVLGGSVEELEAAKRRVVDEVNKPPRGKRNRTGVAPPLATRATLAAWPASDQVPVDSPRNDSRVLPNDRPTERINLGSVDLPIGGEVNASSSAVAMETEETSMVSGSEQSHFEAVPFTYLASLSAKFATTEQGRSFSVRGTIKCFITGVKGFQYKERERYELRVYVDDGSLISEILIDHNVVQNGIGFSPQEVTNALSSSDTRRESEMKRILKQFQIFLINFEGRMVMEMNKSSPVPVAIEMRQGFPASDAWLLLKRLT